MDHDLIVVRPFAGFATADRISDRALVEKHDGHPGTVRVEPLPPAGDDAAPAPVAETPARPPAAAPVKEG